MKQSICRISALSLCKTNWVFVVFCSVTYSDHVLLSKCNEAGNRRWRPVRPHIIRVEFSSSSTQPSSLHVSQKNWTVLFLQNLYQTSLYSDIFWHTYTSINLLSHVYFIFFIKSKSGNQLKFQHYSALVHCLFAHSFQAALYKFISQHSAEKYKEKKTQHKTSHNQH